MLFEQFLPIDHGRSLDYQLKSVLKKKAENFYQGRKTFAIAEHYIISHENVCFGLQYIAYVTANHQVPLVNVAGPSAERN